MEKEIINGLIYSKFDPTVGPKAFVSVPFELPNNIKDLVSLKALNMFAGEKNAVPKSLAVLPFPTFELKGLTKCIRIIDDTKRGGAIDSAITMIFDESDDIIFYKYINNFEVFFNETAKKIVELEEKHASQKLISEEINKLHSNLNEILKDLREGEISTQETTMASIDKVDDGPVKEYRFKIVVCGDKTVGKTSITMKFTDNAFRRSYKPTIGVNVCDKQIRFKDAKIHFLIWDIAGHSKFALMRKHFYKNADGILLVFDLTNMESFQNIPDWYYDVKTHLKNDMQGLILGNKRDLKDREIVKENEIMQLSKKLTFDYMKTSALTGENIDEAFNKLGEILYNIQENA